MYKASPDRELHRSVGNAGFALIALIVTIFVILLFLSVAAPTVARDLRRERELEAVHRGNQYVRAIQVFYRKFNRYPTSIEQLEKTNNIRFLRKQYDDPLTGKPDWRLIHVGEAKTTVKGLFGQPLGGLPGALGVGGSSPLGGAAVGSGALGGAAGVGSTFGGGSSAGVSTGFGGAGAGAQGLTGGSVSTGEPGSGGGIGTQSATTFKGAGGPFMGVGNAKAGSSILTVNEQTDYSTWEFLYDPRIELLKARTSLFGGGAGASPTNSFGGTTPGTTPGVPGTTAPPVNPPAPVTTNPPSQ